jgi:hypothetical protein
VGLSVLQIQADGDVMEFCQEIVEGETILVLVNDSVIRLYCLWSKG